MMKKTDADGLMDCIEHLAKVHREDMEKVQTALSRRMVWRDAWRMGQKYRSSGSRTTQDAAWVCVASTSDAMPGSSSCWRQLTK